MNAFVRQVEPRLAYANIQLVERQVPGRTLIVITGMVSIVRILPIGCEITPYPASAPADCLASNVHRCDRAALAKIRVGERLCTSEC